MTVHQQGSSSESAASERLRRSFLARYRLARLVYAPFFVAYAISSSIWIEEMDVIRPYWVQLAVCYVPPLFVFGLLVVCYCWAMRCPICKAILGRWAIVSLPSRCKACDFPFENK